MEKNNEMNKTTKLSIILITAEINNNENSRTNFNSL